MESAEPGQSETGIPESLLARFWAGLKVGLPIIGLLVIVTLYYVTRWQAEHHDF